jgi:hypothetical protein
MRHFLMPTDEYKKASRTACFFVALLDCPLDLVGAEASCTDVHMARSSVNDRLDALDVGLPCTVCPSMGVGNLDPERDALAADIAFCHQLHLLAMENYKPRRRKAPVNIIADAPAKCKQNFHSGEKILNGSPNS